MPIKAASDKLIREMEMFGQDFENYGKDEQEQVEKASRRPDRAKVSYVD